MSYAQGAQVRLQANYEGIGPVFRIKLELSNLSKKAILDTRICLNFKDNIYKQRGSNPVIPLMLPNLIYKINVEVENIDATGANDIIKVFVIDSKSTLPLITANLSMPVSELNMEQF